MKTKDINLLTKRIQEWINEHYIYRFSALGVHEDISLKELIRKVTKEKK